MGYACLSVRIQIRIEAHAAVACRNEFHHRRYVRVRIGEEDVEHEAALRIRGIGRARDTCAHDIKALAVKSHINGSVAM